MKKLILFILLTAILAWGSVYVVRYNSIGLFLLLLIVGVTGFTLLMRKKS